MDSDARASPVASIPMRNLGPGRLAQMACLLEVYARKPGNVHRLGDFPDLNFLDFVLSATAIVEPLDRAISDGIGSSVCSAIEATRRVVATNTNLGMVLLLAPLASVADGISLEAGIEAVLDAATVDDSRAIYRAIRLARPGGMGNVSRQDLADEPTLWLRDIMRLAADRDLIARQYMNGFREVLGEALPSLRSFLDPGHDLETAIVGTYLNLLARHPDSLIARKAGIDRAREVSVRAAAILEAGWPAREEARQQCEAFDDWLRDPCRRLNPGTTADLVTAALFAALRDGTINLPLPHDSWDHLMAGRPGA
jgi:triphosphoribosyl-dephospho-CoA synthase